MASRLDLHELLCGVLGTRNVYFQPLASVQMKYPAIVYRLDNLENRYANGGVYSSTKCYSVTVIDMDPDSPIVDKINLLPTCRFNRFYPMDNLNHFVFTLYY